MAFLDDARDSLSEDEFASLKRLNQKSADFEATPEEEKELFSLKQKVKEFVATRDRQKNLQVISNKQYPIKDILQVSGYSKKEILTALNALHPRNSTEKTAPVSTVGTFDYCDGQRYGLNKDYADFKKAGLKKAVDGLTEFGKQWIAKSEDKKGIAYFPNKEKFAKMFGKTTADIDKMLEKA